jgi:hypothetical protein
VLVEHDRCKPFVKQSIAVYSIFRPGADELGPCTPFNFAGAGLEDPDRAPAAGAALSTDVWLGDELLVVQQELAVSSLVDLSAPGKSAPPRWDRIAVPAWPWHKAYFASRTAPVSHARRSASSTARTPLICT